MSLISHPSLLFTLSNSQNVLLSIKQYRYSQ